MYSLKRLHKQSNHRKDLYHQSTTDNMSRNL